jgi:hypothetical protein
MAGNPTQQPGTNKANPSSIHEDDCLAVERIETAGNPTINPIIVTSSLTTVEERFTDHDKPLFGPRTMNKLRLDQE